jgi:hypothetical protein
MKSVYSAVRTGYLNKAVCASSLEDKSSHILGTVGQLTHNENCLTHFWKRLCCMVAKREPQTHQRCPTNGRCTNEIFKSPIGTYRHRNLSHQKQNENIEHDRRIESASVRWSDYFLRLDTSRATKIGSSPLTYSSTGYMTTWKKMESSTTPRNLKVRFQGPKPQTCSFLGRSFYKVWLSKWFPDLSNLEEKANALESCPITIFNKCDRQSATRMYVLHRTPKFIALLSIAQYMIYVVCLKSSMNGTPLIWRP